MARAHKHPNLILVLVCLPVFVGALDLTIISAVLPTVIADLQVPIQSGLDVAMWVVSGYLVSYAVSMTFMGRVSDIWGRRFVYLACLIIFFIGSWLVAASPGFPSQFALKIAKLIQGGRPDKSLAALYALIFGRVVQAFGAGAMVPVSMALVADLYPPEKRSLPLGVIGAVDTAGWVLGHLYGGIMVQFMKWPWLFWLNLPMIVVMFALTAWALSGFKKAKVEGGVDWIGAVLVGIFLVALNLGLGSTEASPSGTTTSAAEKPQHQALWLAIAAVFFVVFIITQRLMKHPILNLKIFSNRNLSSASGINLFVGFCLMVGLVSVPLFINVAGSDNGEDGALVTGYLLSAFTVPMALAAIPGGWFSERIGYRWTVVIGLVVAITGFFLMSHWHTEMAKEAVQFFLRKEGEDRPGAHESFMGTLYMAIGLASAGIGLGLTIAPIGTAVINGVDEFERGMASALVIILRLIGMSVSVSTMTAYGLRRTTILSNQLITADIADDMSKTAEIGLNVVTRITGEMALIALVVAGVGLLAAFLLKRGDIVRPAEATAGK